MGTVLLQPGLRDCLVTIGRAMKIVSFRELAPSTPRFLAFSDYAGDASGCRYDVAATYIVAADALPELLAQLAAVKARIPDRTLDYKGRKDTRKRNLYRPWLRTFASHPGLCVAVSVEKPTVGLARQRAMFNRQANEANLKVPFSVGQRMARAVAFVPVIAHLLQGGDSFGWFTDRDALLEAKHVGITGAALATIAQECETAPLDGGLFYRGPVVP